MSFFRRQKVIGETVSPTTVQPPLDLARLDRLLQASIRVRDLGVDYDTIQRRASADEVSLNDALEAIDRERSDG